MFRLFDALAGLLPILPVIGPNAKRLHLALVQASCVDIDPVGVRTGDVEGFDAASRAEQVASRAGTKLILGQRVLTLQEPKMRFWNNQMPKSGLEANRAIAVQDLQDARGQNLVTHAAAMAAALMPDGLVPICSR